MRDRNRSDVTRAEEELDVGVEPARRGVVRVRKRGETEEVAAVYGRAVEQVEGIESSPAEAGDSGEVEVLADGSVSIPIFEERLVVTKQVVVRERLIVRKRTVTETQLVQESLRRERVVVTDENEEE
jgi:uncharacterized protein (TIGR02271 family)